MTLDRFYPIVDSAAWVARLVGVGARLIQLRVKDKDEATILGETREALAICRERRARSSSSTTIGASRSTAGADFVHLGQGDLDGADMAAIRAHGLKVGISTHDEAELARALALAPDYVALGPIYPTILKAMALRPAGPGAHRRMEAARRRDSAGRHRRPQRRARPGVPRRRRRHRLRRHRHHAQRRPRSAARANGSRRRARRDERARIALTIAGSDSGGGAGIQADLKTFAALGVYGASAITALTAQNTRGVSAIHLAPPAIVAAQIEAVLADFDVAAIKIGMLGSAEIVEAVAGSLVGGDPSSGASRHLLPQAGEGERPLSRLRERAGVRAFLIYDPVMVASSGDALAGAGFVEAMKARLLPLVDCLTPNLAEAAALLGAPLAQDEAEMARQGAALRKLGPRAVLMKGGHLAGAEAVDLLVTADAVHRFAAPRLASRNLHGTGCTLSSAIAAHIVLGATLPEAVAAAKDFVRRRDRERAGGRARRRRGAADRRRRSARRALTIRRGGQAVRAPVRGRSGFARVAPMDKPANPAAHETGQATSGPPRAPEPARLTPMMAQYFEIKAANPDCLLFYRMGDFYELFFDDAEIASRALGIVLTKRGKHEGEDIRMCGVPIERADDYLQRLIALGHRVAVCEQLEDPAEAKKRGGKSVVKRDVVRLVTPGTITEERLLEPGRANVLLAVQRVRSGEGRVAFGLAALDISTGAFDFSETDEAGLEPRNRAPGAERDRRAAGLVRRSRLSPG